MKEIKIDFVGYGMTTDNVYTKFIVKPTESVKDFDFSKKYKLVEDVPEYIDTDYSKDYINAIIKIMVNSSFGKGSIKPDFRKIYDLNVALKKAGFTDKINSTLKLMFDNYGTLKNEFKIASFKHDPLIHIDNSEKLSYHQLLCGTPVLINKAAITVAGDTTVKDYIKQDVKSVHKIKMSTTYGVMEKPKARVMFNNTTTILEIGFEKIVVKCIEPDVFYPGVGLTNALYRYYRRVKNPKVTCLENLYGEFSDAIKDFSLAYYCDFDIVKYNKLIKKVNKYESGKWIDLC